MAFLAGIAETRPGGRALTLLPAAPADGSMPARDVAIDGALVYSCHSDSSAVSWLMRRRLPGCCRPGGRHLGFRASTWTIEQALGLRPSTWSISGTGGLTS